MWQPFYIWNLFNISDLKCHNKLRYDAVDIHTREISIITMTMLIYYNTYTFIFLKSRIDVAIQSSIVLISSKDELSPIEDKILALP